MIDDLPPAVNAVLHTSHAAAFDQALFFADHGKTPAQAIDALGIDFRNPEAPTWDDAIHIIATAHHKRTNP